MHVTVTSGTNDTGRNIGRVEVAGALNGGILDGLLDGHCEGALRSDQLSPLHADIGNCPHTTACLFVLAKDDWPFSGP